MTDKFFNIVAMLALGLAVSVNASVSAEEISLRGDVRLDKSVVRLGDVAEVVAADSRRVQQLARLILMPAPAPGTQRFVSRQEIEDLLAAHGEDLSRVRVGGAERVALVTSAKAADSAPVGAAAINREASRRAALSSQGAGSSATQLKGKQNEELHSEIERVVCEHLRTVSGETGTWRVTCELAERYVRQLQAARSPLACTGGAAPWIGEQRFVVSFATTEGQASVPIYASVARSAPMVVATRVIDRGQTITAADIKLEHLDGLYAASGRRAPVKSVEELIGLEAARTIQVGDVIYSDQAQAPLLVKRGENIMVSSQGGGIRVRTIARARQDGARGELIEVESLETKERFDVRVVGAGEAAVFTTPGSQLARRPGQAAPRR